MIPILEPLTDDIAQLWIVAPDDALREGESRQILNWVAKGGTLVLIAKVDPGAQQSQAIPVESFGPLLNGGTLKPAKLGEGDVAALPNPRDITPLHLDSKLEAEDLKALPAYPTAASDTLTAGVLQLPVFPAPMATEFGIPLVNNGTGEELTGSRFEPIWSTKYGAVVARRRQGTGQIIVVTQPEWVSNALISSDAPLTFATHLLQDRTRKGKTLFSEYHHGFHRSMRGLGDLERVPWGRAVLWLGAVLGLAILSSSARFVAVPPLIPPPPPDPAGYARALGNLYQRARAVENIHYNLAAFYRRQSRTVGGRLKGAQQQLDARRRATQLDRDLNSRPPGTLASRELLAVLREERR